MSKESAPEHHARVLEEERRGIADSLAEQDTIRRCDAEASAAELKHEQKVQVKILEYLDEQSKEHATDVKDEAKQTAQHLKDQATVNADKLKH